ncbi:TPA: hypothetical protein I7203_12690 [Vibrio vulnificus]|uniref:TrbC/VirB2 family protein n=1 Tax=Vibrio vulnificus TaxID=672 RepID=UPI0005F0C8C8|nr:TrbC/VirB2 family protein [Vibrio vulnificus]HAS6247193.1 hypothetical protein [Vibrio vulnificus]HAS6275794.1 hypothetical protein [Vibrio vulnificus]HAS6382336.1 hypothetical protein [Vibrio vulnificus]HDY7524499.1 TrbC/VirB2 family protein [Vibrio vulnificus]HDY7530802.1 TrbC/VirB2 family protein [Vibrio vulnificus]
MDTAFYEKTPKSAFILKVVVLIFCVVVIGQTSAIYLPAMNGKLPNLSSLLGIVACYIALFSTGAMLIKRSKVWFGLLGIIVGAVVFFGASFLASYVTAKDRAIDRSVVERNKTLPMMLDEYTQLDKISVNHESKGYNLHLSLIEHSKLDIDVEVLNEFFDVDIKPTTCSNEQLRMLFELGYSINYLYLDKNQERINDYNIRPEDCGI